MIRTIALASAVLVAATVGAAAHAHLKASAPAAGAKVAAPAEIDLAFSEGVDPKFTGVAVTDPGGASVPTGPARTGSGGGATLAVPLIGAPAPGPYRVDWHALAVDGHRTEGSFTFTVGP